MVAYGNGHPTPIIDGDSERVALFSSEEDAESAAKANPLATYGYEVYRWD